MNLGYKLIRALLFVLNIVFLLVGGMLVWYTSVDLSQRDQFTVAHVVVTILLCVGVVLVVVAGCALAGLLFSSWRLLKLHVWLLMLSVLLQVAAAATAVLGSQHWLQLFSDQMKHEMTVYGRVSDLRSTQAWDAVQMQFDCCGVHNYTDWRVTGYSSDRGGDTVPDSCCVAPTVDCGSSVSSNTSVIHTVGCADAVHGYFGDRSAHILTVVAAVIATQVVMATLGCCLMRSLHRDHFQRSLTTV